MFIVFVAGADLVELVFQRRGKVILDIAFKEVQQKDRHNAALVFGQQAVFLICDIAALLDGCHNRRIGRGAADAQLFHTFDKRGLGIAGGRLCEMLFGVNGMFGEGFALGQRWQATVIIAACVIAALFIDFDKAIKFDHLPIGAQLNALRIVTDVDRRPL